jgi:hypothetical protein
LGSIPQLHFWKFERNQETEDLYYRIFPQIRWLYQVNSNSWHRTTLFNHFSKFK